MASSVGYALQIDPELKIAVGYSVTVWRDGVELDQYTAGNHRCDSQCYTLDDNVRMTKAELLLAAKSTAEDMAESYGIPKSRVGQDEDEEFTYD